MTLDCFLHSAETVSISANTLLQESDTEIWTIKLNVFGDAKLSQYLARLNK